MQYDKKSLSDEHRKICLSLTHEQKSVYEEIIYATENKNGGLFFLYGYGGTRKIFIWKTLSAALRSKGEIVLNVASSGIASLLLPGGRTVHSRFRIPLEIVENSSCEIETGSEFTALISKAKLIIWGKAHMVNKLYFEALGKCLKAILRTSNPMDLCFGGKGVVFCGDFRQILPIVPKGSRSDIVYASISSSKFWDFCKVLRLKKNIYGFRLDIKIQNQMHARSSNSLNGILKIGDGEAGTCVNGETIIEILNQYEGDPVAAIVESTYPSLLSNFSNPKFFEERAILAPTNNIVEMINEQVLKLILIEEKEYLSAYSVCKSVGKFDQNASFISTEFLNNIKCSGIPAHVLKMKVGVPVMLLKNMDHSCGLCNSTRLIVYNLGDHIIEAKVLSGDNFGKKVFITRMVLSP